MIAAAEYRRAQQWCRASHRPLVVTHRRPDGDALGALVALSETLRAAGHDPQPTLFEPVPPRYAFLCAATRLRRWDREQQELKAECDGVIILDTCAWSQLEPLAGYLPAAPRTLVVDHHPTRDPIATRPEDFRLIDESAGAVCLLIAEWISACDVALSPSTATALLTGIGTDCGWFRFSNTDARMLRMAASLTERGAVLPDIYRQVYERDPAAKLRLIGRMLDTLEVHAGGRLAVMKLRHADFVAAGADHSMTEDIVNEAGRLAGLEAIVLFTEEDDGRVRVNFRSKRWLDVATVAARYGGGGHARAAGARPAGAWDDVVPRILQDLRQVLAAVPQ